MDSWWTWNSCCHTPNVVLLPRCEGEWRNYTMSPFQSLGNRLTHGAYHNRSIMMRKRKLSSETIYVTTATFKPEHLARSSVPFCGLPLFSSDGPFVQHRLFSHDIKPLLLLSFSSFFCACGPRCVKEPNPRPKVIRPLYLGYSEGG